MTLPAFADAAPLLLTAERQRLLHGAPAAIDRYLLLSGAQQQTRRTPLHRSVDRTARRTFGKKSTQ